MPLPEINLSRLKVRKRNPRTHSPKQIRQIAESIRVFGFTTPVLIDESNELLAGHARLAAAKIVGLTQVPYVRLEHMSAAQKRAYVIADNQLALNSGWDEQILAEELKDLIEIDLDFDVGAIGFSAAEIDALLVGLRPEEPNDPAADQIPQPRDCPARCSPGDTWRLGPHRLVCGDARNGDTVGRLMKGEKARVIFSDPPYNIAIDGNVGGRGAIKHRDFAMACGEMNASEFTAFLRSCFSHLATNSLDGSVHFITMDWRHQREVLDAATGIYSELKNVIVWVKDNGGMGTFYRSRHELIFAFKYGSAPHTNTFELGQHGRYRTNVWEYKGVNTRKAGRIEELAMHPTVKPVQMIADAIQDVSARGEIVLDVFGGSGSTLIAAHKTGRRAFICELDPAYCDIILARWETFAKDEVERVARGTVLPRSKDGRAP
jgi:DNA modification methylase